ncbi:MAG: sigma-54 dependent transcriptional regulator [Nitrospirota bacterium]
MNEINKLDDSEMPEKAIRTMREGTVDGLLGCVSARHLEHSVKKVVELIPKRTAVERPIIGNSEKLQEVLDMARRAARGQATVLITGETGTGKELLARYIHNLSPRKSRPFVAVNCASLPEPLVESELFGHERGAFTGAVERRLGRFEVAQSGTLLLDEIGELPLFSQSKLLRALQEREIDRVGGKEPVTVDVRVIATTNRDLRQESLMGRFREDLFYRVNVFALRLPPLRERREDISVLAEHFLVKHCRMCGIETKALSAEASGLLAVQDWKGNVRELENVIEKAILVSDGDVILPEHLGAAIPAGYADCEGLDMSGYMGEMPEGSLEDMEKTLIMKTLAETGGNKTQAARKLGLTARTIRNKLKIYENFSLISRKNLPI